MNLNRLYKMFGSKSRLSREDITNYGSASDESVKHSIEVQSSAQRARIGFWCGLEVGFFELCEDEVVDCITRPLLGDDLRKFRAFDLL